MSEEYTEDTEQAYAAAEEYTVPAEAATQVVSVLGHVDDYLRLGQEYDCSDGGNSDQ